MRKPLYLTVYSDFDLKTLEEYNELCGTLYIEPKDVVIEDDDKNQEVTLSKAWRNIKEYVRMETNLTKVAYANWIKPLEIVKLEGNVVYLKKPENGTADYIERKIFPHLMVAAIDILDKPYGFVFE